MDPEATQPPAPRNLLGKLQAWCAAHPDWLIAFVFGFIAGAVLFA